MLLLLGFLVMLLASSHIPCILHHNCYDLYIKAKIVLKGLYLDQIALLALILFPHRHKLRMPNMLHKILDSLLTLGSQNFSNQELMGYSSLLQNLFEAVVVEYEFN